MQGAAGATLGAAGVSASAAGNDDLGLRKRCPGDEVGTERSTATMRPGAVTTTTAGPPDCS